jgi:hypothetical protein
VAPEAMTVTSDTAQRLDIDLGDREDLDSSNQSS